MSTNHTLYGTLNLLILKTIGDEPKHGLAVLRTIRGATGDLLKVEEGALYPALHRLERDGLIEATWGLSENRRRAKYYSLTAKGQEVLDHESQNWIEHALAVGRVLGVDWGATVA